VKLKLKAKTGRDPRNLLTSLVLVFPLLLIYQVGVLLIYPMINGADFLTRFLLGTLGLSRSAYLGYTALVALAFAVAVGVLRRRQNLNFAMFIPMLLESAIYALTMGSAIVFVMTRVFHIEPRLAFAGALTPTWSQPSLAAGLASQGLVARMVMSVGAGVWEEATFRLGLLSGLRSFAGRVVGMRPGFAAVFAFGLSAAIFSAVHHIPPYGDPFSLGVFTFRLLAGVFFGLLFVFRGFAVAVYTHALYDLYVLVLHP